MTSEVAVAVIGAVSVLIAGLIAAYLVPRVKWGNEKNRMKYEARIALLKKCRLQITDPNFNIQNFIVTPEYSQIKGLLNQNLVAQIEET